MTINAFHSLEAMTDILANMTGGIKISAQALSQRINGLFAIRYLRRCYAKLLQKCTSDTMNKIAPHGLLNTFNKVWIEDSTSCELDEKLAGAYKGSGGSASKAGYKIHLIWEVISGSIKNLKITKSSTADQSMAAGILNLVSAGDLIIRDLGYYVLSIFRKIADKKAFFLSRLKQNTNMYTTDGKEIEDITKYINKHFPKHSIIGLDVLIGAAEKLPVRLVVYRAPEEVVNQRRRKQNKNAQKKGRTVSDKNKQWNYFTFFITNVPKEIWKAECLGTIYKLRWDIENIFKNWKSNLNIQIIKGKSKNRVDCFILSRLISIFIVTVYFSAIRAYIYEKYGRELSLYKFTMWFLRNGRFFLILRPEQVERELQQMTDIDILSLCKQKRSRLTSLELLEQSIEYLTIPLQAAQKEELKKIA